MARLGEAHKHHAKKRPVLLRARTLREKRTRPVQAEASAARAQRARNGPRPTRRR